MECLGLMDDNNYASKLIYDGYYILTRSLFLNSNLLIMSDIKIQNTTSTQVYFFKISEYYSPY